MQGSLKFAPIPGPEGLAYGHSCLCHFLVGLLQCVLHGAALGDHPEVTSGPECGAVKVVGHPFVSLYHTAVA